MLAGRGQGRGGGTSFLEEGEADGKHLMSSVMYIIGRTPGDSLDESLEDEQRRWEPGSVDVRGSATQS